MPHRFSLTELPETLAIFPLPGALLLPRARLPLNVFEPRYLAMLEGALKTDHRLIGMVQPLEGGDSRASGAPTKLHKVGCAGRVVKFSETGDGRYLIALAGICRFRVGAEIEGFNPYRRVEAQWGDFERDLSPEEASGALDREAFIALLSRYLSAAGLSGDLDELEEADDEILINTLSMVCPFSPGEKQALLEAGNLVRRQETLSALMSFKIAGADDDRAMQ